MRRLFLVVCLLVLALPAGCRNAAPVDAAPPMWQATKGTRTIWLLGSIHLLPPNVRWRTPAIEDAIAAADMLILELPPGDPAAASKAFQKAASATGLPPIEARLPAQGRVLLGDALKESGGDAATLGSLKDWGGALVLAAGEAQAAGGTRDNGVEAVLTDAFRRRGKPVTGFETLQGQFAMFDGLAAAAQRRLLEQAVSDAASPDHGYAQTLDEWEHGDTDALAAGLGPLFEGMPALEQRLLVSRNLAFAKRIEDGTGLPEKLMVAVGSGHLIGDAGVPALLARHGFIVRRIE